MDVSESLSIAIASDSEQDAEDAEDEEEVGTPETIGLFKVAIFIEWVRLVEENLLSADSDLQDYWPFPSKEFALLYFSPNPLVSNPCIENITIRL